MSLSKSSSEALEECASNGTSSRSLTSISQPTHLTNNATLIVTMISHAHSRPLHPPPDLKYDLRTFVSPDKHTRSRYDGRSKRLREWLCKEKVYVDLLERAQVEITDTGQRTERGTNETVIEDSGVAATNAATHQITVGICCQMGRHRSVAFAEELSRRKWPSLWAVNVLHRDVDKTRGKHGKKAGNTKRQHKTDSE